MEENLRRGAFFVYEKEDTPFFYCKALCANGNIDKKSCSLGETVINCSINNLSISNCWNEVQLQPRYKDCNDNNESLFLSYSWFPSRATGTPEVLETTRLEILWPYVWEWETYLTGQKERFSKYFGFVNRLKLLPMLYPSVYLNGYEISSHLSPRNWCHSY